MPKRVFGKFMDILADFLGARLSGGGEVQSLPKPIADRYSRLLLIALVIAALSVIGLACFASAGGEVLSALPFPVILTAAILLYAKYFLWGIRKNGYTTKIGISMGAYEGRDASLFTDRPFALVKKQVLGTLINVSGDYYLLPQPKDHLIIPEGRATAVYTSADGTYFELGGVRRFAAVYGFEILPVPEDEDPEDF